MNSEKDENNQIEDLIPRFCERLTTERENHIIEKWIKEDESHYKMVQNINSIYLAINTLHTLKSIDTEKALKKINNKIGKSKRNNYWIWIQRIAAMFTLPLAITLYLILSNGEKEQKSDIVQMIEVKTSARTTTSVVLPDSTVVFLNSGSTLRYPSSFPKNTRPVELKGEAYFEVTKDSQRNFTIAIPHQSQIEVYGTSFNVEAYEKDNRITTTLVNGKIGFRYKDANGINRKVKMEPGHKLVYNYTTNNLKLQTTTCETETAWRQSKIIFDNTPIEDAFRILGKRFNVTFIIKNIRLKSYAFTGSFTNQPLEYVMEHFRRSSNIKYRYININSNEDGKQIIEIF